MPRRVDPASHFAFFREACFAIVLERGVHELSRRAVAAQLGVSDGVIRRLVDPECPLGRLAADEVVKRRIRDRWFPVRGESLDLAVGLVTRLVPDTPPRVEEELVWLRLLVAGHLDHDRVRHHLERSEAEVGTVVERAVDALRVPPTARGEAITTLRAMIDGTTLAVCTGRIGLEEARATVHDHLATISRAGDQE